MKYTGSIIGWAIIISLLLLSLTFVDFLALTDIHKDYVSSDILQFLNVKLSAELPEWTSAGMEWSWVRISLLVRVILIIGIIITLFKSAKN